MKLDLSWRDYGEYQQYCIRPECRAKTIERVHEDRTVFFRCAACGHCSERRVVIDPAMKWWIEDDGEYWHESAGVFVRDPDRRFLFFERTIFPVSTFTVPAGHVDAGESALQGALRELHEETGLQAHRLKHIASEDITGDSCRRGSDAHRWHAYLLVLDSPTEPKASGEGTNPQWLTLAQARTKDLTHPVRHIIDRHRTDLE